MQRPFLLAMILIASCNSLTQSPRKIDSNIVIADSAYNKDSLLALFINTIYKEDSLVKLSVDSTGSFINFFVYDIVDTANFQDPKMMDDSLKRVKFEDKHIYHFACSFFESSFSNIAYLNGGNISIFRSVNCVDSPDSLPKVVSLFRNTILRNDSVNLVISNRLLNIRKFGRYFSYDNYSRGLKCNCRPCN